METKQFKKIVNDAFLAGGLLKKGSNYYINGDEVVCLVALQKSSYSSGYYINLGIFLRKITPVTEGLSYFNGDIRARFSVVLEGKETDFFDLERISDMDEPFVKESIFENIQRLIKPTMEPGGIKKLLDEQPILLYQTNGKAKEFLGIPV